ncbi:3-keto-disaccharide hydrolase [Prosthecobacter debontii]|nr:DUF1080 domain-containing protein [Prosthecobacter debontii]
MKVSLLYTLLTLACGSLCAGDAVSLFDGQTLNGWTGADGAAPGAGWVIEGGVLHLNGTPGGNLLSEKEYTDFDLEWEWKVEDGGNNGIKYWVAKIGSKEWLGIEYQMIDDEKHPDGKRGGSHTTASIYDIKEPAADKPLNPPGQWNSSRVVVQAGKIQHWLNGQLVCEADTTSDDWKARIAASKFKSKVGFAPGKGRLMLTDHHDKVWIRSIKIKEL